MKKSNFYFFVGCKYLFFLEIVQVVVIFFFNQLKFFNKKRLFRVIFTLLITK